MFLLDSILLSPVNGFMWLMKEIQKAASQEMEREAEQLTNELSNLHVRLEMGELSPDEFDAEESRILDRLEELRGEAAAAAAESASEASDDAYAAQHDSVDADDPFANW